MVPPPDPPNLDPVLVLGDRRVQIVSELNKNLSWVERAGQRVPVQLEFVAGELRVTNAALGTTVVALPLLEDYGYAPVGLVAGNVLYSGGDLPFVAAWDLKTLVPLGTFGNAGRAQLENYGRACECMTLDGSTLFLGGRGASGFVIALDATTGARRKTFPEVELSGRYGHLSGAKSRTSVEHMCVIDGILWVTGQSRGDLPWSYEGVQVGDIDGFLIPLDPATGHLKIPSWAKTVRPEARQQPTP